MSALRAAALLVLIVWSAGVVAGSQSSGELQFPPEKLAELAKTVERQIAARGARVAIISRVGRPPTELPNGIEYTHVAFAVYSRIKIADGKELLGYATHNLYQGDEVQDSSFLKQDYPLDYYAAVFALRAGIVIPTPALQRKLLVFVGSDDYASLHNPAYSAISNPFTSERQNCTEFVLDVINAAIYDTVDTRRIKKNVHAYFEPEPVRSSGFELFLGSIFAPDIYLSDHPGPVRTATFGSIARYMRKHGLADEVFTVKVD